MLPKKHRLAKALEVKRTTARGRSFFNPYAVVKFVKGNSTPRLTVITSTKVSKKAVARNRIKRIAREVVRSFVSRLQPGEYVIIMKAAADNASTAELRNSLTDLFKKTGLLK